MNVSALISAAATLSLGYLGLEAYPSHLDRFLRAAAMLALEPPDGVNGRLSAARVAALSFAVTAAASVIFALWAAATDRLSALQIWLCSQLRPKKAHIVVLGLGDVGTRLVQDLRKERPRRNVIAIECNVDDPAVDDARRLGALVLVGDARDERLRRKAQLDRACEVFVSCGQDGLNIAVAQDVVRQLRRPRRWPKLKCYVKVEDQEFSELLAQSDPFESDGRSEVHVFSPRGNAARDLLVNRCSGLATRFQPAESETPYYVILGFGAMGRAVALQIARLAHFPSRRRTRMTVADRDIEKSATEFRARFPGFAPMAGFDLGGGSPRPQGWDSWESRNGRVEPEWQVPWTNAIEYAVNAEFRQIPSGVADPAFLRHVCNLVAEPGTRSCVVICAEDAQESLRAALLLRERMASLLEVIPPQGVPIFVYLPGSEALAALEKPVARGSEDFPLISFGSTREAASHRSITRPDIAKLAMAVHLTHTAGGPAQGPLREGAVSPQEAWEAATPWERLASQEAAAHLEIKLSALELIARPAGREGGARYTSQLSENLIEFAELLAEVEHNRWIAERLLAGWRYEPYLEGYEAGSAQARMAIRDVLTKRRRRASLLAWDDPLLLDEDRDKDREQISALIQAVELAT